MHFLLISENLIVTVPIIFGKMHFLLISENLLFFHEMKFTGMTSFMEFMISAIG